VAQRPSLEDRADRPCDRHQREQHAGNEHFRPTARVGRADEHADARHAEEQTEDLRRREPLAADEKVREESAVQIGLDAPKTETSPLGTYCSDQKMIAQLDPVLKIPTTTAGRITRRSRGNGCRIASDRPTRITDTATARSNAKTNGGTASIPIFIAAQVEPQSAMSSTYPRLTASGGTPSMMGHMLDR
jgi:hypothetical protein